MTFQIVGGGGGGQWCNCELMVCNKLRGSVATFPKEIFEILTIGDHFCSFQTTFKVHFS